MDLNVKIHMSCFSQDKSRVKEDGDENTVPGPLVPTGEYIPYDLSLI